MSNELITVNVLLFGHLRDSLPPDSATGNTLSIPLPHGATVADLAMVLERDHVALNNLLAKNRVAVGSQFADGTTVLRNNDEVAFLPPMSGG